MLSIGTHHDPYVLKPLQYSWFLDGQNNKDGRVPVYPRLTPGEKTAVIIVLGQSNSANWGTGFYVASNAKAENFNIYDGAVYQLKEPMLGANGNGAGFPIRLADSLITAGTYQRVIMVPIGVGGASVAEWAPGGPLNHRIGVTARRLESQGLTATHVLWHQGETDNTSGTSEASYLASLQGVVQTFRDVGISCPFLVAVATYSGAVLSVPVRNAQMAIVNPSLGIYAGPDTDTLWDPYRSDAAHFNDAGLTAHANLWLPLVQALAD